LLHIQQIKHRGLADGEHFVRRFPIASALRCGNASAAKMLYRLRFRLRHGVGGDASGPLRPSSALARG